MSATDLSLLPLLEGSYRRWLGEPLPRPAGLPEPKLPAWLHERAPYALLAHGTESDPLFCYANRQALSCFGYPRDEFIGMPSRFSASPKDRDERQRLMEAVGRKGYASGYEGWRVDKAGQAFEIHAGVVWNLVDVDGQRLGQAALFWPDLQRVGQLE
ncbi:MEKHLA domain-containing protein [Pseudomonas sp. 102515]|uniref:MEKHLA domain-containing protein n=1 Tax=Pseudomonas sp. 102515 TaxID=3071568 RepID=UPI002801B272|nr:MEKHLA domain-containing protein [Pseudomonas sp. 102515]MDQ7913585.1 MEKHLA domain-containing protein [Pseudomonas sp. 102515]